MSTASGRPRPRKSDHILLVDRCLAPEIAIEIATAPSDELVAAMPLLLERNGVLDHELLVPLTALGLPAAGDFPALGGPLQVARVVQETFRRHVWVAPFYEDDLAGLADSLHAELCSLTSAEENR